ncbi:membrane bound O-acyl transferase family-domain-containing protein [Auriculariales sp. MPI-PUGE-AT-0066]|nr:membrane bound O-acyl transferase family-domain-containing protein [Auriculariales sp. MPI-PUGE-AT-0066]
MEQFIEVLQWVFPPQAERIPITPANSSIVSSLPWLPFTLAAFLSRMRNTELLRAAIIPVAPFIALRAAYGYVYTEPTTNWYNWISGMLSIYAVARTIEFCVARPGRLRVCEKELPAKFKVGDVNDMLCSGRGFGWDFGTGAGLIVPKNTKPLDRRAYFWATVRTFIINFFFFDLLESLVKLSPSAATPAGGTIFLPELPPLQRYLFSTAVHVMTGMTFVTGFTAMHELCAFIDVFILGHSPEDWPPLFDSPWASASVSEFWSRRWHQTMRPAFLDLGGYPLQWLLSPFGKDARRLGLVMGTFLASGFLHDFGMWNIQREFYPDALYFFGAQGAAVCLEYIYYRVTGRKVGGWVGMLWAYAFVVVGGQPMINGWHMRGIGNGVVWPPHLSPARQLLFPAVRRLIAH